MHWGKGAGYPSEFRVPDLPSLEEFLGNDPPLHNVATRG